MDDFDFEVDPSDFNFFDYDGDDIGTATVKEMRLQNGDY